MRQAWPRARWRQGHRAWTKWVTSLSGALVAQRRFFVARRRFDGADSVAVVAQGGGERRRRTVAGAARALGHAQAAALQLPGMREALLAQPVHGAHALLLAATLRELAGA